MLQVCVCERERGREREICMIELVLLLYVESNLSYCCTLKAAFHLECVCIIGR